MIDINILFSLARTDRLVWFTFNKKRKRKEWKKWKEMNWIQIWTRLTSPSISSPLLFSAHDQMACHFKYCFEFNFFFLNQFLLLPFCWPLNFNSSLFICNPRCVSSTIKKYCHQNPVWEKETKTKTKQHVYSLKWKVFVNNRDVSSMFCLCSFVLKTLFIQLFSSLSLILFLVPPAFLYFSLSCH